MQSNAKMKNNTGLIFLPQIREVPRLSDRSTASRAYQESNDTQVEQLQLRESVQDRGSIGRHHRLTLLCALSLLPQAQVAQAKRSSSSASPSR